MRPRIGFRCHVFEWALGLEELLEVLLNVLDGIILVRFLCRGIRNLVEIFSHILKIPVVQPLS